MLNYVGSTNVFDFDLKSFLDLFRSKLSLRRSIDKIFEIVVYSLFQVIIQDLTASVSISVPEDKIPILNEFQDFTTVILGVSYDKLSINLPASVYRVGVTNASDRGLDMWANFGPAIQIKHFSLTEEVADEIVNSITADRIIIVCKNSDKEIISKILHQISGSHRVQGIIVENDLIHWYKKAFIGNFRNILAPKIIEIMKNEIVAEFPTSDQSHFSKFLNQSAKSTQRLHPKSTQSTHQEIAKLGHTAGIHMILATQRATKTSIDTTTLDNLEARICFRTRSVAGSVALLGDKSGSTLPDIPGRAIWQKGIKSINLQVPY